MNNKNSFDALMERLKSLNGEPVQDDASKISGKAQYNQFFWEVMRGQMPKNALKEGSDGSGGFLVPDEYENMLLEALKTENVLRRISHVVQTRHTLKIPTVESHASATWVEENGQILDSDDQFGQLILDAYKIATRMLVSEELMEDTGFEMQKLILSLFSQRIGECEEEAFLSGDGNKKPTGLLTQAPLGAVSSEAGKLSVEDAFDLYFSVSQEYRLNGVWLMSDDAYRELYKVKSAIGRNIWEASLTNEEPQKLLGCPVFVSDFMPVVAAGNKPILFGDFQYFWIGDRGKRSIKRLNERYADFGQIGFIATQRVDAKLVLPEAIKSLGIKMV